ncbi:MAG: 3-keto-5-aminohexanoate cleavage protein [Deltaproteobacteria bacterium]|nr:3-keto-5-aminohexanoate cleavage protein [Deltaproteobacteria bacterium]
MHKATITCALTGVLTDPKQHPVPVTAKQMADSAYEAFNAGASIMHCHFRKQEDGLGHLPTWEPDVCAEIVQAIRDKCKGVVINLTTGVMGDDISGPVACLDRIKPEMAALNAGSLNYLKLKSNNTWAWPPLLFDNPVSKIEGFTEAMKRNGTVPECECFDTGILRSVVMFERAGLIPSPPHVSLIMGVASGMPAKPEWLPLLVAEMSPGTHWQTIAIGRQEVWAVHRKTAELGGDLRSGVEDTFYLPNGEKATGNGQLIEAMAKLAREVGREIATPADVRVMLDGYKKQHERPKKSA